MKLTKRSIALLLALLVSIAAITSVAAVIYSGTEKTTTSAAAAAAKKLEDDDPPAVLSAEEEIQTVPGSEENLFTAKFEGDAVEGTAENVEGAYRVTAAKTDGEAWHIKLECNYHTTPYREYRVTYHFHSDVGGLVKFGDFQEFRIQAGDNAVTGILIASEEISYLDFQLGMLKPFTIDFTKVEVEEQTDDVTCEDVLAEDFRLDAEGAVWEQHDEGYEQTLNCAEDEATLTVGAVPNDAEVWKSRLYVRTGFLPEPGVRYLISAELTANQDLDYEICYNKADWEKGYAARYGLHLKAEEPKTVEQILAFPVEGAEPEELILQLALGKAPKDTEITLRDLRVEKITDGAKDVRLLGYRLDSWVVNGQVTTKYVPVSSKNIPLTAFSYGGKDTVYERHDGDYVVSLTETASSAVMKIEKAPEADRGVWKAKLYADTGLVLEGGTTYRIKFDLKSAKDQAQYEVCFDGDYENAYGALYNRSLTAGGTDSVEYVVTPEDPHGPLVIRLQLGNTDSAAGNTFTFSGLTVEKLSAEGTPVGSASLDVGSDGTVWEEHSDGMDQTVSADGSKATLTVNTARDGGGVWSSRLFVKTGATPEPGARYRVDVTMSASKAVDEFEIVCDNGGTEAGYAKQTGLSLSAGETKTCTLDFTAPGGSCSELILRLQLGNTPANNTISVSGIQVRKLTSESETLDLSGLAYPVTTDPEVVEAGFVAQPVNLWLADSIAWDGFQQEASVSGGTATLHITQARPEDVGGVWCSRLHLGTGVVLEQGVEYEVSATLSSEKAMDFELLLSNGNDENDDVNPGGHGYYNDGIWGLHVDDNGSKTITQRFTVPERSAYYDLILRFQLGNSPAPNDITVTNVSVKKWVPEHTVGGETVNNSFDLETNNGTAATLTGDGSSATATVTVPGDDWHIKLYAKPGVTLEAGKTYEISMNVTGANGCAACFKRAGGEETDFGMETISGQTVTHTVTPTESGTLEILLKLGNVPANSAVKVSNIQIKVTGAETAGENLATASLTTATRGSVNFWAHDDYQASLSGNGSSASLAIQPPAEGREAWKVKLFSETGLTLEAGKSYRILADVKADADLDYEICYNDREIEKALGASYGLHASAKQQTVSFDVAPEADAELILQFNLGNASEACTFTVTGVRVEELGGGEPVLSSFRYDSVGSFSYAADGGYAANLEKADSSATFRIEQAPADRNPWNAKLFIRTGFTPENGKGYRVSFDVKSAKAQKLVEVFYDGGSEAAYGALYEQSLPAGTKTLSYEIVPGSSKGELVIQFRPGKTNGTDGNSYTITNVKIEEVTFEKKTIYGGNRASTLWTHETYKAELEKHADSVTVTVKETPAEGMEAWKTKLFLDTGVVMKPGVKYRISIDVTAEQETGFEICYNNDGAEKGIGAQYGLTAGPETRTFEYTTYGWKYPRLVIQVSLGNVAAPNKITVSNVRIERLDPAIPVVNYEYLFPQTPETE